MGFFFKIIIIIIPTGESTRARSHLNFTRDGGGNRSAAAAVAVGPVYRNFFFHRRGYTRMHFLF